MLPIERSKERAIRTKVSPTASSRMGTKVSWMAIIPRTERKPGLATENKTIIPISSPRFETISLSCSLLPPSFNKSIHQPHWMMPVLMPLDTATAAMIIITPCTTKSASASNPMTVSPLLMMLRMRAPMTVL